MYANGTLFGIYRALVVTAVDPEKQGRVKVHIPDLMVDEDWGTKKWCKDGIWARPANNWIGGRNTYDTKGPRCNWQDAWYQGSCMIPPQGTHVFLFFEKGDPSHPFYFAAADYGQTKVLPENRVGSQWWKKWTPIKTRMGRALVFSDDPDDERVEITGKKRHITRTPDGDTKSVFDISCADSVRYCSTGGGNQTTFLIDERPGHEKVLLKDHRGNFIKMIQDEAGKNDQLHIFMHDDIHIETLKNIYVRAHENIHITADKDYYLYVGKNMYVKVEEHFWEMAKNIDRYTAEYDLRFAGKEINDSASQHCVRCAGEIVRDIAMVMCSRSCSGNIADGCLGSMSIDAAGTMSVTGTGSVFVDSPASVLIQQGSAVIPPSLGYIRANPSQQATPPEPDPDRYKPGVDDGWEPEAPDKNRQDRIHPYWKSQYVWTPISQTDASTMNPTAASNNTAPAIEAGGHSSDKYTQQNNNSNQSNQNTSQAFGNNNSDSQNQISTQPNSTRGGNNSQGNNTSQKSVSDAITNVLANTENLVSTSQNVVDSGIQLVSDMTSVIVDNVIEKIQDVKDSVAETVSRISDKTISDLKNRGMLLINAITDNKITRGFSEIASDMIPDDVKNEIKSDINNEIDTILDDLASSGGSELKPQDVINAVSNAVQPLKERITNSVNTDSMSSKVSNIVNNYGDFTKNTDPEIISDAGSKSAKDFSDTIDGEDGDYSNAEEYLKDDFYPEFVDDYSSQIDNVEIPSTVASDIINSIEGQISPVVSNRINDFVNNRLPVIVNDSMTGTIDISQIKSDINYEISKTIDDVVLDVMDSVEDCLNDGLSKLDDSINKEIDPIGIVNKIYDESVKPVVYSDALKGAVTSIITVDTDALKLDAGNALDSYMNSSVSNSFAELPTELITGIIDQIPTIPSILDNFVDYGTIDKFTGTVFDTIDNLDTMSKKGGNCVMTLLHDSSNYIDKFLNDFDHEPLEVSYSYLCNYDPETEYEPEGNFTKFICGCRYECDMYDTDKEPTTRGTETGVNGIGFLNFCAYITKNFRIITDSILDNIRPEIIENLGNIFYISNNTQANYEAFVNNIVNSLTRASATFINNVNSIISETIQNSVSEANTSSELSKKLIDDQINELISSSQDTIEKLKSNIDYDVKSDMDDIKKMCVDNISNGIDGCKAETNVLQSELINKMSDITKNIENISDYADFNRSTVKTYMSAYNPVSNIVNDSLDTICYDIFDLIKESFFKKIQYEYIHSYKDVLLSLYGKCNQKNPTLWTTEEIIDAQKELDLLNMYLYTNFKDSDSMLKYINEIGMDLCIICNMLNNIEDYIPTKDSYYNSIVNDVCAKSASALVSYITNKITQSISLSESVDNNEFDKNIDLTKVYKIPGVESSKHKCNCEDENDPVWCDPEIIGGCGCLYEYTLFLKQKFYNTIIPMLYNDGIKTIGISLNPDLSKLKDKTMIFHDDEIIRDYRDLIDKIYSDQEIDLNNKFLRRIDEIMSTIDRFDFCCVLNILDFECTNYKWLDGVDEMMKYTHDMADEHFIKYICLILKHVFYKVTDTSEKRRLCRIVVNVGNRSFQNKDDIQNEKFSIYPNCGFIRELIMKLAYKCDISTNYMSITANEKNNLYYYNPYTEFKSYDDDVTHNLVDYEICVRDYIDKAKNGRADCVQYDEKGDVVGGYLNYYKNCSDKSYCLSYIDDLMEWCLDKYNPSTTYLQHFTRSGEVDSNIMNYIFSPRARMCMRYFYRGHEQYFNNYKDIVFDPDSGEIEE